MKPMSTDYSKLEKGEESHLLDEGLVKPLSGEDNMNLKVKGFSWCRCLCRTLLICLAVLLVIIATVAFGSFIWMRHQVKRFTVDGQEKHLPQPPLPVAPLPDAKLEIIKDQAKLFWDQLRAGEIPNEDLVITEEDINGLIASSDYLRGHAIVHISEGHWTTELALPMDKLPGGKGRFFVGTGEVQTQVDHGDKKEMTRVLKELTPKYPVHGLDFPTIMKGKYVVYNDANNKPVMEMDYGQFLNWVAPDDWIAKRENLLNCDDDKGCHGKHHHHKEHHHHHHHHHHDDDDDVDCEEFMDALARLERITLQDKKIIFTPVREVPSDPEIPETLTAEENNDVEEDNAVIVSNVEEESREALDVEGGGVRGRHLSKKEPSSSSKIHGAILRRVLRELL